MDDIFGNFVGKYVKRNMKYVILLYERVWLFYVSLWYDYFMRVCFMIIVCEFVLKVIGSKYFS